MNLTDAQYLLFGFSAAALACGFVLGLRAQNSTAIVLVLMFTLLAVISAIGPHTLENLIVSRDGFTLSLRTPPGEAIQLENASFQTQEAVEERVLTIPERYRTDADYLALATVAARKSNHLDALKYGFAGLNQPSSDRRVEAKLTVRVATALGEIDAFDEALSLFDEALAIDPDLNWGPFNKGILLTYKGRRDEALDSFRLAVEIDPTDRQALRRLEDLLRVSGPPQEYERVRQQLMDLDRD